jgi:hypothetical protein
MPHCCHPSRLWAPITAIVLTACGGGGDSATIAAPNSLAKYQGAWVQQCAERIPLAGGGYSAGSVRETLVFSAANSAGAVSIESTEDFFDSVLACYDDTTPPYASVKNLVPVTGSFARKELLAAAVGNAEYDVLKVNQVATLVGATGSGISSVDVAGEANWRITFSDGSSTDRKKNFAALAGEVALLASSVPLNGVATLELRVFGGDQPYRKRKP